MQNRIKALRKSLGLNQTEFGARLGLVTSTISGYESGVRAVSDAIILSIVREFGCSETWLRTGEGEMFRPLSREAELGRLIRTRLVDRPDSFQAELVRTLLRFDPDGPEMRVLEQIMQTLSSGFPRGKLSPQATDEGPPPDGSPETKKDPEP